MKIETADEAFYELEMALAALDQAANLLRAAGLAGTASIMTGRANRARKALAEFHAASVDRPIA